MASRSSQLQTRFAQLLQLLREDDQRGFVLAELNDLLASLTSGELSKAVEHADLTGLTPYLRNYVAAMVELAAHQRDMPPPAWVRDVEPLEMEPHFATPLAGRPWGGGSSPGSSSDGSTSDG